MGGEVIGQTDGMDREGRQELRYGALEGDVLGIRERLALGDDIGLADNQGFTALHSQHNSHKPKRSRCSWRRAHRSIPKTGSGTHHCGVRSSTLKGRVRRSNCFSSQALTQTSGTR